MALSSFHLLNSRRFLPIFITQFMEAFNDSAYKIAIITLITYELMISTNKVEMLVVLANALFILPFFLFSAICGKLADKYNKTKLVRIVKIFEIFILMLGAYGFYKDHLFLLYFVLFLMAMHSTLFGPLKYSVLPELLEKNELVQGNAWVEASTFMAILLGSILASVLVGIASPIGSIILFSIMIGFSIIGWLSSLLMPITSVTNPQLTIKYNFIHETMQVINYSRQHRAVHFSIIGISWLWFIGATIMTVFPIYTKHVLNADAQVFALLLTLLTVGVAVGSLLCSKLLKGDISAKYVPLSMLLMSLFLFDFCYASSHFIAEACGLISIGKFLSNLTSWRLMADLVLLSIAGGIFIVPLYAIIQTAGEGGHRSRIIASNNIINSLFIIISALFCFLLFQLDLTSVQILLIVGLVNLIAAIYTFKVIPEPVIVPVIKRVARLFGKRK